MNQRQRNNNIFIGGVLIFLAIYMVSSKLISLPGIPVIKILFSCLYVYLICKGVKKKNYPMIFIPSALLLCQYDDILGIESITPGVVLFASILLTIGCQMVFKKGKSLPVAYNSGENNGGRSSYFYDPVSNKIVIDNGLGETTRYITEENVSEVVIDNGLGKCVVYFQGCTMKDNIMHVKVDNGLGATSIYCPKEWSINLAQDNGLGAITVNGNPSSDPQAPCFDVFVDNGLGAVDINFI